MSLQVGSTHVNKHRIYSDADIHAGAIVFLDRRTVIEKLIIKDHPNISPIDLVGIIRGVELYATCGEKLFTDLEAQA